MLKKIGIYIGAFDPIHKGHIDFANKAIESHKFDKLYFLVEPSPRHRQGVKSLDHRINMAILGVESHTKLGTIVPKNKVSLDDYIKLIQTRFNDHKITLIIPDNGLKRFFLMPNLLSHDFHNMDLLVGLNTQTPEEVGLRLKLLSETSGLKFSYSWFSSIEKPINSSDIKKQIRQGIRPEEIPNNVWKYIVKQKLYAPLPNA